MNLAIFSAACKGHLSREVIIYKMWQWINVFPRDILNAIVLSKFAEEATARFLSLLR